jgi:peptidoglycan/xylan/chitin deacetylase (PgdA/CDA1 family)
MIRPGVDRRDQGRYSPAVLKTPACRPALAGLFLAAALSVWAQPTPAERDPRHWAAGYYDGDPLPPATVYLTFDDGPGDFTAGVLDILRDEGVAATFFINSFERLGPAPASPADNWLMAYGRVLRRMVAEGHAVGNHTFSHQVFGSPRNGGLAFQLDTLQEHFVAAFGPGAPRIWLLRPPFGSPWLGNWNGAAERGRVTAAVGGRGAVCLWTAGWDSADSVDWVRGEWWRRGDARYRPGGPAYLAKVERIRDRILDRADGLASGVVLMHDIHPTTRDALRGLVRELKARGYRFGTMADYAAWRWGEARVAAWRAGSVPPVTASARK